MPGFEGSGSRGTNVAGVDSGGSGSAGGAFLDVASGDIQSLGTGPATGILGQHVWSRASERRRVVLAATEAQTADIAQLKDTVSQLGAMMMEMRDVVAELQAGDHEEDENGEDAGTGESILRGQEPKVKVKEDIVAWENPSARKIWLISGVRPVVWGMKREELQAVLSDVALVTPAVTSQVAQCSAFNVSDYMPHGDPVDPSADLNVLEQMEMLVDVVIRVVGKGAESAESMARVEALRQGVKIGADAVKKHKQQCTKVDSDSVEQEAHREAHQRRYFGMDIRSVRRIRVGRRKVDFTTKHRAASLCTGPDLEVASWLHQRGRDQECGDST